MALKVPKYTGTYLSPRRHGKLKGFRGRVSASPYDAMLKEMRAEDAEQKAYTAWALSSSSMSMTYPTLGSATAEAHAKYAGTPTTGIGKMGKLETLIDTFYKNNAS